MNLMPLSGKGLWEAEITAQLDVLRLLVCDRRVGGRPLGARSMPEEAVPALMAWSRNPSEWARVSRDHDAQGAVRGWRRQDARRSLTELHGQGGCEQIVGQAAYAVGSEESHGNPPEGDEQPHPATGR